MTVAKSATSRKDKRARLRALFSLPPMVTRQPVERWGAFRVETHRPWSRQVHDDRFPARPRRSR